MTQTGEGPPTTRTGRLARIGLSVAFLMTWVVGSLALSWETVGTVRDTGRGVPALVVAAVVAVLVLVVWVWHLRSDRRWPVVLVFALALTMLGLARESGISVVPLTSVTLVLVTHRLGPGVGWPCAVLGTGLYGFFFWFYQDVGGVFFAAELVVTLVLFCLVVIFATMLRHVEAAERRAAAVNEELRATNEELTGANERLQAAALAQRDLVLAEERARTSGELHDGLGHRLTLVGMSLDYALRMQDRDAAAAWAEVGNARAVNQESLDMMRRWVRALHPPPHLPDATGPATFDAIADSFRGTGLEVTVGYEGMEDPPPLPADVGLLAHRLVQEGLTNVLRHADAQHVRITMRQQPGMVEVALVDDGTVAEDPGEGFGRRNLRERAEALGGTVSAAVVPGGGFEIMARVPLPTDPGRRAGPRTDPEQTVP